MSKGREPVQQSNSIADRGSGSPLLSYRPFTRILPLNIPSLQCLSHRIIFRNYSFSLTAHHILINNRVAQCCQIPRNREQESAIMFFFPLRLLNECLILYCIVNHFLQGNFCVNTCDFFMLLVGFLLFLELIIY